MLPAVVAFRKTAILDPASPHRSRSAFESAVREAGLTAPRWWRRDSRAVDIVRALRLSSSSPHRIASAACAGQGHKIAYVWVVFCTVPPPCSAKINRYPR